MSEISCGFAQKSNNDFLFKSVHKIHKRTNLIFGYIAKSVIILRFYLRFAYFFAKKYFLVL